VRRRHLLAAGAGAIALPAAAQPAPPRVGFLIAGDPEPSWTHFRKSMAELGYVEGQTVRYEYPLAGGLPERAAALVAAKVNVIVAVLTPAITAAQRATSTIPIVLSGSSVDGGVVKNLARPEGNLTGVLGSTALTAGKVIQIFREVKPATKTVAVALNQPDPFHSLLLRDTEAAGREQGVAILPVMIKNRAELPAVFEAMARQTPDGVYIQPSLPLAEVAALALKHRLVAISSRQEFTENGGLMSYGPNQPEIYRLVAGYVDKLLKGSPTASLPAQMPTRFHLVVNQKTAKAMGLTFSPMFLGRADEVIE
jgi:putative tryptophan/tyrosine transport system substrate-binding protein